MLDQGFFLQKTNNIRQAIFLLHYLLYLKLFPLKAQFFTFKRISFTSSLRIILQAVFNNSLPNVCGSS